MPYEKGNGKTVVIALGGNALGNTPQEQLTLVRNTAKHIDEMDVAQAEEYIKQGQFAPGSMLPKVEACIEYVEAYPEGRALITSLECAAAGLRGETGTVIVAD